MDATAPQALDERDLLERAVRGDARALADVFEAYRPALRRYARELLGDANEADDVVQETFVRAWRAISSFDVERPFWPWIQTIARRLCFDEGRRRARRSVVSLDRADVAVGDASDRIARSMVVSRAMRALPPRYRRALYLHAVERHSYAELAASDRSTVTSIAKVLSRARQRLQDGLGSDGRFLGSVVLFKIRSWLREFDPAALAPASSMTFAVLGLVVFMGLDPRPTHEETVPESFRYAAQETDVTTRMVEQARVDDRSQLPDSDSRREQASVITIRPEGPNRNGADPTGGGLWIEIVDHQGRPVFWHRHRHSCFWEGDLTPPSAPARMRC